MDNQNIKYSLLANKNKLLFTKLPNALFSTPQTPPSTPVSETFQIGTCCDTQHTVNSPSPRAQTPVSGSIFSKISNMPIFDPRSWSFFNTNNFFSSSSSSSSFSSQDTVSNVKPKPTLLINKHSVQPPNLGGKLLCPNQIAILDLVTYFDVVNMCVSAQTSPIVKISSSDVCYSESSTSIIHQQQEQEQQEQEAAQRHLKRKKNTRKLRKFIMSKEVSLDCFERKFLHRLMLECFESPFDEDLMDSSNDTNPNAPNVSCTLSTDPIPTRRLEHVQSPIVSADESSSSYQLSLHQMPSTTSLNSTKTLHMNTDDANLPKTSYYDNNASSSAIIQQPDDNCLHVQLVHPAGNVHEMLTNYLSTKIPPTPMASVNSSPQTLVGEEIDDDDDIISSLSFSTGPSPRKQPPCPVLIEHPTATPINKTPAAKSTTSKSTKTQNKSFIKASPLCRQNRNLWRRIAIF